METETNIRRCAIYTRKSLEDTVEKDYNSIDAQRDAGEAYVASQKANGWVCLPERYDDYGFSGGNTERPALQRLMADCEAHKVDVVVIYKIDRLSRSICDFTALSAKFEAWGVSLVAVTQQIDTSTSAGRMMLNILMTFAQYEREVIAERIRDKFAASKRKGMWMGGTVPFGYRAENRKLVIVPEEAEVVRFVFRRYAELRSPRHVALELNGSGTLKRGRKWTVPLLEKMLRRSVYVGKVEYKGETYDGEHEAIIDAETWALVREGLDAGKKGQKGQYERSLDGVAPLKGILRCGNCGCAMTPSFTYKGGRKYCFYICSQDAKRAEMSCPVRRLPAGEIESYVFGQLGRLLATPQVLATLGEMTGLDPSQVAETLGEKPMEKLTRGEQRRIAELLLDTVTVGLDEITMDIKTAGMEALAGEAWNEDQN